MISFDHNNLSIDYSFQKFKLPNFLNSFFLFIKERIISYYNYHIVIYKLNLKNYDNISKKNQSFKIYKLNSVHNISYNNIY